MEFYDTFISRSVVEPRSTCLYDQAVIVLVTENWRFKDAEPESEW